MLLYDSVAYLYKLGLQESQEQEPIRGVFRADARVPEDIRSIHQRR